MTTADAIEFHPTRRRWRRRWGVVYSRHCIYGSAGWPAYHAGVTWHMTRLGAELKRRRHHHLTWQPWSGWLETRIIRPYEPVPVLPGDARYWGHE